MQNNNIIIFIIKEVKMLNKIKEAINKREREFSNKSKKHQQSIIKKNMFISFSCITSLGLILSFIGIVSFFNPKITERLFLEEQEIKEVAPSYLVKDFKDLKENTIFKRKDILNYKVSKEEFYTAMMNKFENKMLEEKRTSEEIKEYLGYEEKKLKKNLSLVEEGLFFIIENKNYKELIATNKNGFIGFYNKKIKNISKKEKEEYLEKIENFEKNKIKKYKGFQVGKIKINNKDILEIIINKNIINPYLETRNNYLKSKFTEEEFYFSLFDLMNGLNYKSVDDELKSIFYYNAGVKDSFNIKNSLRKDLEKSLNEATKEVNEQIDKQILFIFISFIFFLFFFYGYKKEKKTLKDLEMKEKQLLQNDMNKEIKSKEKVKVEETKV